MLNVELLNFSFGGNALNLLLRGSGHEVVRRRREGRGER